ncbi:MAG: phosphotransferase [Deltaproteobacteria bacterium]|nr:phosphotransferase [Deltaproteobacteria bacterium]
MLPPASTAAELAAIRRDEVALRPGVDAILASHHMSGDVVRFADGSLPVYAIGDTHVLKLYPPVFASERETEASVLSAVAGKLSIPTPRVEGIGDHGGWSYVLMSRLHGESLSAAWPRIPARDRERLLADLGKALAALHAIRAPLLDTLAPPDWGAFVAGQRTNVVEHQRSKGLGEAWLAQIPAYLESVPLDFTGPRVLLHTEVMREHLLVREGEHGWELSGLFDFEPAMCGAPEYELASVGVFVSCGDARLLRTLLLAYGYREDSLDETLARRLLAYAIVHRYSNLRWYLERLPPLDAPTLDALAVRGWGTI